MAAILGLDHVQLAMPPGGETKARAFFSGLLGFTEVVKPANLAARGGCWFRSADAKLHLGVEQDFAPARKAHPAFVVDDLQKLASRLSEAGVTIVEDEPLDGYRRAYVNDPFGNRLELMQRLDQS